MIPLKIEVTINAEDKDQLAAAMALLQSLASDSKETVAAIASAPPAKKKPAAKPEAPVKKKAVPKPEAPAPEVEDEEESELTVDSVRAILAKTVNPDNRKEIKKELERLGAKNVTALDPSNYSEFVEFLNSL